MRWPVESGYALISVIHPHQLNLMLISRSFFIVPRCALGKPVAKHAPQWTGETLECSNTLLCKWVNCWTTGQNKYQLAVVLQQQRVQICNFALNSLTFNNVSPKCSCCFETASELVFILYMLDVRREIFYPELSAATMTDSLFSPDISKIRSDTLQNTKGKHWKKSCNAGFMTWSWYLNSQNEMGGIKGDHLTSS